MRRKQLATAYLQTVEALRRAVEHEANRAARERAVEKFRAEVNPIINQYTSSSDTQTISNCLSDDPAARHEGEDKVRTLFSAVNGLARAGKEAAAENPDLAAHYLKCARDLGTLWIEAMAGDTDA